MEDPALSLSKEKSQQAETELQAALRELGSERVAAVKALHHLANCMYHRLEENEAKRSSLLPFDGIQI